MKKLAITFALLLSTSAFAQNYPNMNQADMENVMQQMQRMQQCMESVDQNELKKLEHVGREMESTIKSLCAKGKRDQAQKEALGFAKEMSKNSAIQSMRKCAKIVEGMMPKNPLMMDDVESYKNSHVCDNN